MLEQKHHLGFQLYVTCRVNQSAEANPEVTNWGIKSTQAWVSLAQGYPWQMCWRQFQEKT